MPAGQRPKEGEEDWREPLTVSDIPDTEVLAAFFKYLVRILPPAFGQDTDAELIGCRAAPSIRPHAPRHRCSARIVHAPARPRRLAEHTTPDSITLSVTRCARPARKPRLSNVDTLRLYVIRPNLLGVGVACCSTARASRRSSIASMRCVFLPQTRMVTTCNPSRFF
jgi:hypothetical protein